jgi:hypothetical protein
MHYLWLFQCNDGFTNAPACVIRTLQLVVIWRNGKWFKRVKQSSPCLPFSLCFNEFYILFAQCMCVYLVWALHLTAIISVNKINHWLFVMETICLVWRTDTILYTIRRILGFIILIPLDRTLCFPFQMNTVTYLTKCFNQSQRNFNTACKSTGMW